MMSDWPRKHLCDLVNACRQHSNDLELSESLRGEFGKAHAFAKQYASLPNAGCLVRLHDAIAIICAACRETQRFDCTGRIDWQDYCALIDSANQGK